MRAFNEGTVGSSFAVCEHRHESRTLNCNAQHLLVPKARASVVALSDVSEVINVGFERGVIFPINVGCPSAPGLTVRTEGALLRSWFLPALLGL